MHINTASTKRFKYINFEKFEKKQIAEIKKYFQQNKELKLIIIIIPNSPGTIYSKHIVFFSIVF